MYNCTIKVKPQLKKVLEAANILQHNKVHVSLLSLRTSAFFTMLLPLIKNQCGLEKCLINYYFIDVYKQEYFSVNTTKREKSIFVKVEHM